MTEPLRGNESPSTPPDSNGDSKRVALNLGPLVGPDGTVTSDSPFDPLLDAPALANTATNLAAQAEKLAEEVAALRVAADTLAKRASRNEWAVALTAVGLVLDIALSVFAFVLLNNQSASNVRLEASIHEQCSLYTLILPSYNDAARLKSPLGPTAYDDAYKRIQTSADHLNCGIPHRI